MSSDIHTAAVANMLPRMHPGTINKNIFVKNLGDIIGPKGKCWIGSVLSSARVRMIFGRGLTVYLAIF